MLHCSGRAGAEAQREAVQTAALSQEGLAFGESGLHYTATGKERFRIRGGTSVDECVMTGDGRSSILVWLWRGAVR